MKKILVTLVTVVAIAQFSYGQWNTGTGTIYPTTITDKVGIGTTSPTQLLDVRGGNIRFGDASNPQYIGKGNALFTGGSAVDMAIRSDNGAITFGVGGTETMRLTSSGNLGIGTTSPSGKLDVNGNTSGTHVATAVMFGTVTSGAGALSDGLTIQRAGSGGVVTPALKLANYFTSNASQDVVAVDFVSGDGSGVFTTPAGRIAVATSDVSPYMAFTVDNTERIRIDDSGNVGIGTTTPHELLSVNGNIRSQQVKVELANWPDYVFKSKYALPSLTKVKTYINKYQHLPDMPSEKEVANDGLNLGEVDKQLTKKVEELTLYLIQQQKINQSLQKQITRLSKQLKTVKK